MHTACSALTNARLMGACRPSIAHRAPGLFRETHSCATAARTLARCLSAKVRSDSCCQHELAPSKRSVVRSETIRRSAQCLPVHQSSQDPAQRTRLGLHCTMGAQMVANADVQSPSHAVARTSQLSNGRHCSLPTGLAGLATETQLPQVDSKHCSRG